MLDYARRQKLLTRYQSERIKNLLSEQDKNRQQLNDSLYKLRHSEIVLNIHHALSKGIAIRENEWADINCAFQEHLPSFEKTLLVIHELSQVEWRVCMLLKLGFVSSDIAKLVNKSSTTIPSIRSRLYSKFFLKKGRAADWDSFVDSI